MLKRLKRACEIPERIRAAIDRIEDTPQIAWRLDDILEVLGYVSGEAFDYEGGEALDRWMEAQTAKEYYLAMRLAYDYLGRPLKPYQD